ncbi:ATP-binding cassette domain-containing protein [Desulfobulbus sp. AH-315-M07]|nr:ATP-binding cassette domain-containing protein [Desulfobulbus sp. AH-315-M07]
MTEVYPAIRVRHLWHRFGFKTVLSDVTFDVHAGEIFGFIGPNGAGKTTTIRVMATLLEPMAGRVEIEGIDVTMEPERVRRLIGYMPDHAGVYERVSVREYLEFFADAYRIPSLGIVDAVLELTDIRALENQLVVTLSKGQKQRLQLARILLHDPKVLILDEPASDLDPRARIEIRDLLLDLQSLGKTILLSSHILSELADVCTSVGILEGGRMVVAGPIDEIGQRFHMQQAAIAHGHAPPVPHGHMPWQHPPGAQAMQQHGMVPQAPGPQGMAQQGMVPHGVQPQAMAPQAPVPQGPAPQAPPVQPMPVTIQRRGVKIRVLGDPNAAAAAVQGGPGILDVKVSGGATLQIGYAGDDQKVAQIVAHLVHRNYGIVSVEHERNELERIFLEATQRQENRP